MDTSDRLDAFLSHNWGTDQEGRSVHKRVLAINQKLISYGIKTWCDENQMTKAENTKFLMAQGIENSRIFIAFITDEYRQKVNSNNAADNCFYEFNYASFSKPNSIIPVVMESSMRNPREWKGILGASLGTLLYIDMVSDEEDVFEQKCRDLYDAIQTKIASDPVSGSKLSSAHVLPLAPASTFTLGKEAAVQPIPELLAQLKRMVVDDSNLKKELDFYVPLKGTANGNDSGELLDKVTEFLQSNMKALLLRGNAGAGKTTFLRLLHRHLWSNYDSTTPIPFFVSLPSLLDPIQNLIPEALGKIGFNVKQIAELKNYSLILLLDGFDEIDVQANLYHSNNLHQWNAKIIVTCRNRRLEGEDNYAKYFFPHTDGILQRDISREIFFLPFSPTQIRSFLEKMVTTGSTWTVAQFEESFAKFPELESFISTPFILKVIFTVFPEIMAKRASGSGESPDRKITLKSLYDEFVSAWFTREENRLMIAGRLPRGNFKQACTSFCKKLATAMHEKGLSVVQYCPDNALDAWDNSSRASSQEWDMFFSDQNPTQTLIREACPLSQNGFEFRFFHKSLQEYFVARNGVDNTVQVVTVPSNSSRPTSASTSHVVGQPLQQAVSPSVSTKWQNLELNKQLLLQEDEVLQFYSDAVTTDISFKTLLLSIIEASKADENIVIAAINAMTILNRAKVTFSDLRFEGVRIGGVWNSRDNCYAGADLSGSRFINCKFNRADLRGVNWRGASLCQVSLRGANLEDSKWGERPTLTGHRNPVREIAFASENLLVSIEVSSVYIWDVQRYRYTGVVRFADGETITAISVTSSFAAVVISSSGIYAQKKDVYLICLATGQRSKLDLPVKADTVCFSPSENHLWVHGYDWEKNALFSLSWPTSSPLQVQGDVFPTLTQQADARETRGRDLNSPIFSRDSKTIYFLKYSELIAYDLQAKTILPIFDLNHLISAHSLPNSRGCCFAVGDRVLAMTENKDVEWKKGDRWENVTFLAICYLETSTVKHFRIGSLKPVAIAVSPQDTFVAISCGDGSALLWDTVSERIASQFYTFVPISSFEFSKDGKSLVYSCQNLIHTLQLDNTLPKNGLPPIQSAYLLNGGLVLGRSKSNFYNFNVQQNSCSAFFSREYERFGVSKDGKWVYSADTIHGDYSLWSVNEKKVIKTFKIHSTYGGLKFVGSSWLVVKDSREVNHWDGYASRKNDEESLSFFDLSSNLETTVFSMNQRKSQGGYGYRGGYSIESVSISPDGKYFAYYNGDGDLWCSLKMFSDQSYYQNLHSIQSSIDSKTSPPVAFSPSCAVIFSGSFHQKERKTFDFLKVFHLQTKSFVIEMKAPKDEVIGYDVKVCQTKDLLAYATTNALQVVELPTNVVTFSFDVPKADELAWCISSNFETIAIGSAAGSVTVIHLKSGKSSTTQVSYHETIPLEFGADPLQLLVNDSKGVLRYLRCDSAQGLYISIWSSHSELMCSAVDINECSGVAMESRILLEQKSANAGETEAKFRKELVVAISSGNEAAVKALLKSVDLIRSDIDPKPYLFHAIDNGNPQILRLLLEWGVDASRPWNNELPLAAIRKRNRSTLLAVFLDLGAVLFKEFFAATYANQLNRALGLFCAITDPDLKIARFSPQPTLFEIMSNIEETSKGAEFLTKILPGQDIAFLTEAASFAFRLNKYLFLEPFFVAGVHPDTMNKKETYRSFFPLLILLDEGNLLMAEIFIRYGAREGTTSYEIPAIQWMSERAKSTLKFDLARSNAGYDIDCYDASDLANSEQNREFETKRKQEHWIKAHPNYQKSYTSVSVFGYCLVDGHPELARMILAKSYSPGVDDVMLADSVGFSEVWQRIRTGTLTVDLNKPRPMWSSETRKLEEFLQSIIEEKRLVPAYLLIIIAPDLPQTVESQLDRFLRLFDHDELIGFQSTAINYIEKQRRSLEDQRLKAEARRQAAEARKQGVEAPKENKVEARFGYMMKSIGKVDQLRIYLRDSSYPVPINMQDSSGMTLLHQAVVKQCPEAIRFLVAEGASLTLVNNGHLTPYDIASASGKFTSDILDLLRP